MKGDCSCLVLKQFMVSERVDPAGLVVVMVSFGKFSLKPEHQPSVTVKLHDFDHVIRKAVTHMNFSNLSTLQNTFKK